MNSATEMLFKQWEKMFSGFMDYLVRNETFLSSMGKMMESSSIFKMVVDKSFERALESMRMPTRKDLEETLYAIRKLESSILDTQEQLDAISQQLSQVGELVATQARIELGRAERAEAQPKAPEASVDAPAATDAQAVPKASRGGKKPASPKKAS